jgi:hypothetical protein
LAERHGAVGRVQGQPGLVEEHDSGRGGPGAVGPALEQLQPERGFQLGDSLRQRRLGDAQPGRRPAETAFVRDRQRVAKQTQVGPRWLCRRGMSGLNILF